MKILYGVQGTGNGHIARARVMAKAFTKRHDVDVDFLFSGREPDKYFDMEAFGDYRTFNGLSFITERGAVSKWKTFRSAKLLQLVKDVRELDLSVYDLVLNDFEPVSAWAAKRQDIPSISISHQAAFNYPVPKKGDNVFDRLLTRYFAPGDIKLGVHWYHFGHSIMPPFIEEKMDVEPSNQHFLVYLPFENISDVQRLLSNFPDYQFESFHPDILQDRLEDNVSWRKPSKALFRNSIKHCAGVVANAGFELSSECLQLGKKVIIKPLKGQYEQLSNMVTLERLGLCTGMLKLDEQAVGNWLSAASPDPIQFPSDPGILIDWITNEEWADTALICDKLWRDVRFPKQVQSRISSLMAT